MSDLAERMRLLLETGELSDVKFKVENELIMCHKIALASSSCVYKAEFYGDHSGMTLENDTIEINDISLNGFRNMIRYIYGHGVKQFEFEDLFQTFKAADKYLVVGLGDDIVRFMTQELRYHPKSFCILFDQLTQIDAIDILPKTKNGSNLFQELAFKVQFDSALIFNSEHFRMLSPTALIYLLRIKYLDIKEPDLLMKCVEWCRFREANSQDYFDQIKEYIRFEQLTIKDYCRIDAFHELLSNDLSRSFLSHLLYGSSISICCKTDRQYPQLLNFGVTGRYDGLKYDQFCVKLSPQCSIAIKSIQTSLPFAKSREIKMHLSDGDRDIDVDWQCFDKGEGFATFIFSSPVRVDMELKLKFRFPLIYSDYPGHFRVSNIKLFPHEKCSMSFTLENCDAHYIEGIQFYVL